MHKLAIAFLATTLVGCASAPPSAPSASAPVGNQPEGAPATAAAGDATPAPIKAGGTPGAPGAKDEFVLRTTEPAREPAKDAKPSKIKSTATEAALKLTVVDKEKGPVKGIVIALTGAADGQKRYTEETDADGYTEILVPVGQKYDLVFLSLGRRDITGQVTVTNEPKQNIRLTLRYKRQAFEPVANPASPEAPPRFVLGGVTFDTGKAVIRPESFTRLDSVVEFLTHKKSARIEISGHTDDVGSAKVNQALSEKRAQACRDYLVSKGIDKSRITAVGHGGQRPIAPNDSEEGRQKNRRIEATEM